MIKILPKVIAFEWDKWNKDKNFIKHEVSNQEAEEIFFNKPIIIADDKKHSALEKRFMLWGKTNSNRSLTIFFTIRNDKIRVISARDMNKKERGEYEKT